MVCAGLYTVMPGFPHSHIVELPVLIRDTDFCWTRYTDKIPNAVTHCCRALVYSSLCLRQ